MLCPHVQASGSAKSAGLPPAQKPVCFSPSMWTRCEVPHTEGQRPLWGPLSTWGGGMSEGAAGHAAPALSPAPLTPTSDASPWHPLHLPSPPTGNDIGQISEVHMSWTVSLGIFWASSLLYVSYPFHSKLFFFLIGKMKQEKRLRVLLAWELPYPLMVLGKLFIYVYVDLWIQCVTVRDSHYLFW